MENELKEEIFTYLDMLRKTGETNMMGAGIYLQGGFHLSKKEAQTYLLAWMKGDTNGSS